MRSIVVLFKSGFTPTGGINCLAFVIWTSWSISKGFLAWTLRPSSTLTTAGQEWLTIYATS